MFVAMLAEAKAQAMNGTAPEKQGELSMRFRVLAELAFMEEAQVRSVVKCCVNVGLLEMLEETETAFQARLIKWDEWEPKDSGAAARKRKSRATSALTEPDDPLGDL